MSELTRYTLGQHIRHLEEGRYTSRELTEAYIQQIEEKDGQINAVCYRNFSAARMLADQSDARRREGRVLSPLDGIPYAAKDNFCTKGLPTACASKMLAGYLPDYDATVVKRLEELGAVLLAKVNMDELAMGSTNEHSIYGPVHNPIDPDRVPGGSSGGSAAAVAALEVPFALGSDTGGSVRQPAAFCGVVGFKPTYGAISRYGLVAFASSLDTVGILSRNAEDAELLYDLLKGRDPKDLSSVDPVHAPACPGNAPLQVGVVREILESQSVSEDVKKATRRAIELLRERGAVIRDVSLPSPHMALSSYCVLSAVEAASNLARFDGIRFGHHTNDVKDLVSLYEGSRAEGFGSEVKRRILFGTCMLSSGYRDRFLPRALSARRMIRDSLSRCFADCDLILNPTTPTTAFLLGAHMTPEERREADLCAVYANLAGLPAISVPMGADEQGLPLGVHLMARPFEEALLLRVSRMLEEGGQV